MKRKKVSWFWKISILVCVFFVLSGFFNLFKKDNFVPLTTGGAVLALDLKGVLDGKGRFLKDLRRYVNDDKIKGVLIRLDSPGGDVAVSQEIYYELKRTREELEKPVVVSAGSMMTSGALYAAVGASAVVVNPGTLVGSIGVIFPLMNMERLYDWAKLERDSIKTGEFKDAGVDWRPMTSKERALFQDLVNELLDQFKMAILEGRKIPPEALEPYTDARVFTGEAAVGAGFADSVGAYSSAVALIGEMTGLGENPKLFTPEPSYFDLLSNKLESGFFGGGDRGGLPSAFIRETSALLSAFGFHARPLYIFPPFIGM